MSWRWEGAVGRTIAKIPVKDVNSLNERHRHHKWRTSRIWNNRKVVIRSWVYNHTGRRSVVTAIVFVCNK